MPSRTVVPQLERLTSAIGYVCIYWAWLEDYIGEMILDLAPFDPKRFTPAEREQLRDVILTDTDIRTKVKILRAVAFIRKWDDAWFKQVDKTLNKIDNDIRARRNRVVHSSWFTPKGRLLRHRKFASLKKPQAFAKQELTTNERVPVKMAELWKLGRDILAAQIKLVRLYLRHEAAQKYVDDEISKIDADRWLRATAEILVENPSLLPALLSKSVPPRPHQKAGGTRRKSVPAKRRPQTKSSPP